MTSLLAPADALGKIRDQAIDHGFRSRCGHTSCQHVNAFQVQISISYFRIFSQQQSFGTKEKYGWLLHPITLRIYNADHEADYANGFEPDVKIEELVIGNDLLPFGDTNERLLSEALSRISGLKSLPVHAESEGRILLTPSSLERKQTKGLIFEEGK